MRIFIIKLPNIAMASKSSAPRHICPHFGCYTMETSPLSGANDRLIGHKATEPTGAQHAKRDLQALPEVILKVNIQTYLSTYEPAACSASK
jgi:hypothetical protein